MMTIRYNIDGKDRVHVESYTLYEWVEEVQEASWKGYKVCLDNDRFPQSYIGYYSAYFDSIKEKEEISLNFVGGIPTLNIPPRFMNEDASTTEKAVYQVLKRAIQEISNLYNGEDAVGNIPSSDLQKEEGATDDILFVDSPALSVEDYEEVGALVDSLEDKINEAAQQLEAANQSPAEQVNNQDADTATDIGAFPKREEEAEDIPAPTEQKDSANRPVRRGRPPRNA